MAKKTIHALRAQIAELKSELHALDGQPVSRTGVEVEIAEQVDRWHAQGQDLHRGRLLRAAAGRPVDLLRVQVGAMSVDLGPVLALLLGKDALRDALQAGVDTVPKGLPPAARAERMAALRAELFDLEVTEEREVLAAVDSPIARRHDADPAALLAA